VKDRPRFETYNKHKCECLKDFYNIWTTISQQWVEMKINFKFKGIVKNLYIHVMKEHMFLKHLVIAVCPRSSHGEQRYWNELGYLCVLNLQSIMITLKCEEWKAKNLVWLQKHLM
jgi:hypothetical protein